jgi:hypothetical protein
LHPLLKMTAGSLYTIWRKLQETDLKAQTNWLMLCFSTKYLGCY